jgi:trehalose 6-phosphate synthase/phosphatase
MSPRRDPLRLEAPASAPSDPSVLRNVLWKFGVPLMVALGGAIYLAIPVADRMLTEWFQADVDMRAQLVFNSIEEGLEPLIESRSEPQIRRYLARVASDRRLVALVVCARGGTVLHRSESVPKEVDCPQAAPRVATFELVQGAQSLLHVARFPMEKFAAEGYSVVVAHDLGFIDRRQSRARDYLVAFLAVSGGVVLLLCLLVAWVVLRGWVVSLVRDIRGFALSGKAATHPAQGVLSQVRQVLREIEDTQRLEADFRENWTPEGLQQVVHLHLEDAQLIVVSNREPYVHNRVGSRVEVQYPASGMVTALEPVVRACAGVWIAHGSGNADRDVVDLHDRVRVPPQDPRYSLRRVWLSEAEEQGYYYGFSNEGLWPLCHLAYVRPIFRSTDWEQYRLVAERFADAVHKEARGERPLILVQDYHFSLLPGLIRERLPEATIALFWHIPWPNAETFGICPWRREMLQSMLQADILGFHTRYHCQNFMFAVDRYIESHIDREHSTVTTGEHVCHVNSYPISIEWPPSWLAGQPAFPECRKMILERFGLRSDIKLGVGVERWDYTKGIVDRMQAIERLLETEPQWRGQLVFLQIAAPSRSKLPVYQELQRATTEAIERVNQRFGTADYKPVILAGEHWNPDKLYTLYRACDFCVVNSLHDGMNLVAKEFVAAREDNDGVLVLSTFAGASRELVEALIINPFDIDGTAQAISQALRMPREERHERMRVMRQTVRYNNVFRWAGRMLMDAARIRQRQKLQRLSVPQLRARSGGGR